MRGCIIDVGRRTMQVQIRRSKRQPRRASSKTNQLDLIHLSLPFTRHRLAGPATYTWSHEMGIVCLEHVSRLFT